jgi:hypothetical protein
MRYPERKLSWYIDRSAFVVLDHVIDLASTISLVFTLHHAVSQHATATIANDPPRRLIEVLCAN